MKCFALILAASFSLAAQTAQYPSSVVTDAQLKVAKNRVQTVLRGSISTSDTVITVASATNIVANMLLSIDSEIVSVTSVSGNNLTVVRGFDNTTAAAHSSGRTVSNFNAAWYHMALAAEMKAVQTALGANLSNVGAGGSGGGTPAASYNFSAQTPGGSLVVGANAITMTPVPLGVSGTNTNHYLYVSGGVGTAEACLISGGSGTSGQASGQIIITCANTHSGAWTIQSASGGIQEAIWAAPSPGSVTIGPGSWSVYGTITKPAALQVDIVGAGSASTILAAQFASGNVLYVDGNSGPRIVRGLQFQPALVRSGGAELYTTGIIDGTVDDIFVTGSQPYIGIVAENFIRTRYGNMKVVNTAFRGVDVRVLASSVAGGEFSDVNITAAVGSPAAMTFTVGASGAFAGALLTNIAAQGGQYNVYLDNTAGTINELQFSNLQIDGASVAAFFAGGTGTGNGLNISTVRVSPVSGGKPFYIGNTYSDVTIANVTGAKVGNVNGIEIDGATGVHLSDFSMDGSNDAGAADACVNITANSGTPTTNVTLSGVSCGRRNAPTTGLVVSGSAHVNLRIDNSEFFGTTPILDQNTNKTAYANVLVGSATAPLYSLGNYIATEGGANNAIAATFGGAALQDGLTLTVKLAHTLQAGANTFNLNGGGAVSIKSSRNPANDIGTAYAATGTITLLYDSTGPYWLDVSQ